MGRGFPICEVCIKSLWNTLKTMFLNVKLQRLCKSHHLQCITSKDLEKLEKSLCVRDKAEDLCWMPVVFGPSDDTTSLIVMILSLTFLNELRNTSRNHFWKTIRRAIFRCQLKLYRAEKEAICEHGPEVPSYPVGQGSFKMYCFKVEKCSTVRQVKMLHSCWKSRMRCPPG